MIIATHSDLYLNVLMNDFYVTQWYVNVVKIYRLLSAYDDKKLERLMINGLYKYYI